MIEYLQICSATGRNFAETNDHEETIQEAEFATSEN